MHTPNLPRRQQVAAFRAEETGVKLPVEVREAELCVADDLLSKRRLAFPQPAAAAPKAQASEAPAKVAVQLPTHFKPVVLEEPEKARCSPVKPAPPRPTDTLLATFPGAIHPGAARGHHSPRLGRHQAHRAVRCPQWQELPDRADQPGAHQPAGVPPTRRLHVRLAASHLASACRAPHSSTS